MPGEQYMFVEKSASRPPPRKATEATMNSKLSGMQGCTSNHAPEEQYPSHPDPTVIKYVRTVQADGSFRRWGRSQVSVTKIIRRGSVMTWGYSHALINFVMQIASLTMNDTVKCYRLFVLVHFALAESESRHRGTRHSTVSDLSSSLKPSKKEVKRSIAY